MDSEWLNFYEKLTSFNKASERIVWRVKGADLESVQGDQFSEEYIVLRERVTSKNDRPSISETSTYGNHAPVGQAQDESFSARQEIPVSIDNISPEGNEDQYVTYLSGEALGINVYVRHSNCTSKYTQQYSP